MKFDLGFFRSKSVCLCRWWVRIYDAHSEYHVYRLAEKHNFSLSIWAAHIPCNENEIKGIFLFGWLPSNRAKVKGKQVKFDRIDVCHSPEFDFLIVLFTAKIKYFTRLCSLPKYYRNALWLNSLGFSLSLCHKIFTLNERELNIRCDCLTLQWVGSCRICWLRVLCPLSKQYLKWLRVRRLLLYQQWATRFRPN